MNRSAPPASVIPVVSYPDIVAAAAWLEAAFGFTRRLIVFDHRIQMNFGSGNFILTDKPSPGPSGFTVMIRIADCRAVCQRARAAGAEIGMEPTDHVYGERQCDLTDPWGVRWVLTETLADVDPAQWGGTIP